MKKLTGVSLFILLFSSCPIPFNETNLSLMQDLSAPVITINTPVQGSSFESTVTVSGSVIDVDGNGEYRSTKAGSYISSCVYDILDSDPVETAIEIAEDGTFSFTFPSVSFTSQINLIITAHDINGNKATSSIILVPDENGPFLTITSPEDYSVYATVLLLAGSAVNSLTDSATTEVNPVISYRIPGTSISGTANIDTTNGSFSAVIDVSALEGNKALEVTAEDLNGNETTAIVTITKPTEGGDISGFTVTPGNKMVTISWDPVPFAESYTIFESEFGTLAEEDVTSPYEWEGLSNGEIYSFQLTAHLPSESGEDAVSAVVTKMPLSPRSLAPSVREIEYGSVTIQWREHTNVSKYTVERATSPDGPWQVRGNSTSTSYTDTSVENNREYFYRIRPAVYTDITSDYCSAVPTDFGEVRVDFETEGTAQGIDVSGSYAYLGTAGGGKGYLRIIDISDPGEPVEEAAVELSDAAKDVVVEGSYAYVAASSDGLAVIDISNPLNPGNPVYGTGTTGFAYSLDVANGCVYLADGDSGLAIIDVSTPTSPGAPVYCDTVGSAFGVAVDDGYAYVADYTNDLVIVDLSDPTVVFNTCALTGNAYGITVAGDYAYVAAGTGGLAVINISDPSNPGTPHYSDTTGYAQRVAVAGRYAYVANDENLFAIIDVSDPDSPGAPVYRATMSFAMDVALSGSHAYVVDSDVGIAVFSIAHAADPAAPVYESTNTSARGVAVTGSRAYLAVGAGGMAILDVSDPSDPGLPDYQAISTPAYNIEIAGSHAYIALNSWGLAIIDISDPENPVEPVYFSEVGYVLDVAVSGSYAFIAANENGLAVIDISDPEDPGTPIYKDTTSNARNIVVQGDYAYIATNETGLAVIDISDPENPGDPVYEDTSGWAWSVAVSGNYAYIADRGNGLAVFDITDPANPGAPTYYATNAPTNNATSVAVAGPWVFVTDYNTNPDPDSWLAVFDASDPAALEGPYYSSAPFTSEPYAITVRGPYAYIADSASGLAVVKLWEDIE
ncbi:MAG: hypothetical protein JW760_09855 [Spirochaetales bacterium]|nr:hypothetical protein [Spirochaetales bacterium]